MNIMLALFLLNGSGFRLAEAVDLEVKTVLDYSYTSLSLSQDGTILIGADAKLYHFDTSGHQIRRIGQKGQGPGEFESGVYFCLWDGRQYLVFDYSGQYYQVNPDGSHTRKIYAPARCVKYINGQYFSSAFDGEAARAPGSQGMKPFFRFVPERFPEVEKKILPTSQQQKRFAYNFLRYYLTVDQGDLLVVNELDAILYRLDAKTLAVKQQSEMVLPHFKMAEGDFVSSKNFPNKQEQSKWWNAFSRVRGIDYLKPGKMVVCYFVTDPEDPYSRVSALTVASVADGKAFLQPQLMKGEYLGVHDGQIYFLHEDDGEDKIIPRYYVEKYVFEE